ncbi:MAG TPA: CoA transferase [Casimicrobiaceae bacterium]|nr:CoA transferase [Casimicrobiaceae bacterium]
MSVPFLDLRVVESSAFIAAPLAGLTLAQFGADVIRVEMIGGGIDYGRLPVMPSGRSLYWTGLNKNKRSIAVDLRRAEGRELVKNLVTASRWNGGVLLTNIVTQWLAHALLAKARPDVITCTIEGNPDGTTAVDYTVNSATGYPMITGAGSPQSPVNHVLPAWDVACAFQAAFAVVSAVERRRRTGQGAELRIALSDVAFAMLSHLGLTAEAELLDRDRPAIGNYIYGAFGRDFGTKEGARVIVAAISSGQWTALVKACAMEAEIAALERASGFDFAREAERYEGREAIAAIVERWCAARTLAEVQQAFDANRVCWGPYRTTRDLLRHDARVGPSNPVWERIETAGIGAHLAAGTPVRAPGEERSASTPAPLLGQHTDEVLHDVLGLDSPAIGRLHDAGVVAGPERDPTLRNR